MASNAPPRRRAKRAYRGPAGGAGGLLPRLWHTPLWATLLVVTVMGCGLGYLYPNPSLPAPWGFVQSATGWTYTAAWSLSFYPQVTPRLRRSPQNDAVVAVPSDPRWLCRGAQSCGKVRLVGRFRPRPLRS